MFFLSCLNCTTTHTLEVVRCGRDLDEKRACSRLLAFRAAGLIEYNFTFHILACGKHITMFLFRLAF